MRVASLALLVLSLAGANGQASSAQDAPPFAPGVARMGPGIKAPTPLVRENPDYSDQARRAGIEGDVHLDIVVNADGTVGDVRIVKSLDRVFGLDENAIRAVKAWRFAPAERGGQALPVVVSVVMSYHLGERGRGSRPPAVNPLRPWPNGLVYPPAPANTTEFMKDAVDVTTPGVTAPTLKSAPAPVYTSATLRARVEGDAIVEAVIEPSGKVSRVRLKQGLHPDLDKNALQAALDHVFEADSGRFNGRPARIMIPLVIQFRVR